MSKTRKALVWTGVALATGVPLVAAAFSPQLAWRDPVYILAGLAGVVAMALLLVQPLLIGGYLPDVSGPRARRIHRVTGMILVGAVVVHVGALWITSPPDVVDALLFASPTQFSVWGVIAMWAVLASAAIASQRKRLSPRTWRTVHVGLAAITATGTVIHALLIDGTMEQLSKIALAVLVALACGKVIWATVQRTRRRKV